MKKSTWQIIVVVAFGVFLASVCLFFSVNLHLNRFLLLLFIAISLTIGITERRSGRLLFCLCGFFVAAFMSTYYILIH
ncbi:hypothetical protein ACSMFR_07120 [Listeria aquatica]|uniref:DUF3953 domain-containing protein n=1 Tax=Listeria aquatica TaxID=1494960 RepID=A0A841ZNM7_9LIST|nr:hypothetical protein [Listeria aquatica]MBC1520978.1 hypothetical protein [Listeria aquatica]